MASCGVRFWDEKKKGNFSLEKSQNLSHGKISRCVIFFDSVHLSKSFLSNIDSYGKTNVEIHTCTWYPRDVNIGLGQFLMR